ncbi:archaellin/type IV pilin N-terminal domain-containing protein [Nanoarchaeota archaeon]
MKLFKKKGISPLVATVLLIAFAVALGAIVFTWAQALFTNQTDQADKISGAALSCSYIQDIDYRRITYDNDFTASYGNLTMNFDMSSEPRVRIQELTITIQNAARNRFVELTVNNSINPNIVPFDLGPKRPVILQFEIDRDYFDENISIVTVTPEIDVENQEESRPCNQRSREITDQEDELENN